jgi:hypothetical protein
MSLEWLSMQIIKTFLISKHIVATKGFAAWGPLVAPSAVVVIIAIGLAIFCPSTTEVRLFPFLLGVLSGLASCASGFYFGIGRHLPPIDSPRKSWCVLLVYCFPPTISEPFYNHLCELQEMMRLQGRSTRAITWETVRQLILLVVQEVMKRVLDALIPIKKPTID